MSTAPSMSTTSKLVIPSTSKFPLKSTSPDAVKLVTGAYLEVPYRFEGAITAITAAGSGNLLITTLT